MGSLTWEIENTEYHRKDFLQLNSTLRLIYYEIWNFPDISTLSKFIFQSVSSINILKFTNEEKKSPGSSHGFENPPSLGFCFRGLIPRGSKPEGNIKRRLITIAGVNYRKKHFRGRETII